MKSNLAQFINKRSLIQLLVIVVAVTAICGAFVSLRHSAFKRSWTADPTEAGFFWTENAFHFRHFMIASEGRAIPPRDFTIQHPEGLDVQRYVTPVMERVTGWIYWTFLYGSARERFILWYTFVVSTLAVPAIVIAVRSCGKSIPIALLCAVLYGLTPASFYRAIGEGFLREHFALPFIFLSFSLFLGCFNKDRWALAVASAVTFAVALASWHVTQLYLTIFMVGCGVVYIATGGKNFPWKSMVVFCAVTAVFSLTSPVLRAKWLIVSPALMLGYGIVLCSYLFRAGAISGRPRMTGLGILAAFVIAGFGIHAALGTYSHVYALLFDKIRFMGRLPADPTVVSVESRLMWTSSFVSPGFQEIFILMQGTLIAGAIGAVVGVGRIFSRTIRPTELLILFMAAATFVLFLLMDRMSVFAVFFVVLAGAIACDLGADRQRIAAAAGLLVLSAAQLAFLGQLKFKPMRPSLEALKPLYLSVINHTVPNAAFLTTFQLGPGLAAYTQRPVVLHSKFESPAIRKKVVRTYEAWFKDEAEFYEECKRLTVDFVVHEPAITLLRGRGSVRFIAGKPPLSTSSAAFRFQFAPEKLAYFIPVFQTSHYRGFAVDRSLTPTQFPYDPLYDLDVYAGVAPVGSVMSDALLDAGRQALQRSDTYMAIGQRKREAGEIATSILMYKKAVEMDGGLNYAAGWRMGELLAINGQIEDAANVLSQVASQDAGFDPLVLDIQEADLWTLLGKIETTKRQRFERAIPLYERALNIDPSSQFAISELATALIFNNEADRAVKMASDLVTLAPSNAQAHALLAKSYYSATNFALAIEAVDASLALDPEQANLNIVRKQLQELLGTNVSAQETSWVELFDDDVGSGFVGPPAPLIIPDSPEITFPASEDDQDGGSTN